MKISYLVIAVLAAVAVVAMAGDDVAWCKSKDSCGDCVKGLSCVWCPEEGPTKQGACFHGKPWGVIDNAPNGITKCAGYRYLQCKIPGLAFMILVCSGAGLVLILLFLCICCCCCCRKKKQSTTSYAMLPSSEQYNDGASSRDPFLSSSVNNGGSSTSAYSAHPQTDARRRELNEKYNKYRSPAESYY